MRAGAGKYGSRCVATFAGCVLALLLLAPTASAAPAQLWTKCDADEPAGQQCSNPRGVAANPLTGQVFLADQNNRRIVAFDAFGQFLRAWGWDVVASGPGDDTVAPEDQFEICSIEDGDVCKAGVQGGGTGQLAAPQGVALDSAGAVYVADKNNERVQKFDRAGEFVLAWGGDVVFTGPNDTGADEQQQIAIAATAGSFRLGLSNTIAGGAPQETAPLAFNASAAQVQAALNALPTISALGGSVTVTGGPGDATGSNPYLVSFGGNLANDDVPQLAVALDVGSQLKCSTPTAAESISYQWYRNSDEIDGATASTYTATESDKGRTIQCRVTAANANAGSVDVSTPAQVIAPAPQTPVPTPPTIAAPSTSAPLAVGGPGGQTLTCDPNQAGWQNLDRVWGYRWYRNGVEIDSSGFGGAFSPDYEVTAADLASPAVFQCEAAVLGAPPGALGVAKVSQPLATAPAPSAPAPPAAQASTAPGNGVVTAVPGGGHEVCRPADTCKGGSDGAGNGEFGGWEVGSFIASDGKGTATAADDSVFVGDEGRIQGFDVEGSYVDECDTGDIPSLGTVTALAADSAGDLYAKYTGTRDVRKLTAPPSCELLEEPVFELPQPPFSFNSASALAVGPAGEVFAFGLTSCCGSQDNLNPIIQFDPTGNVIDEFGKGQFGGSTGLATNLCPGSEAPGNLYVANTSTANGFIRAYGTEPAGCGLAITGAATAVEETTATVHGTVNPNGLAVEECTFEFGLTAGPYEHSSPCAESPASLGEGSAPVPVHADLSGLPAGTVIHYRVIATSAAGTEQGADRSFKTKGPPLISDEHLVSATDTEATLKALVNPEGFPTTYRMQYVTEAGFEASGFEGALSTPEIAIGEDRSDHPALAHLQGLLPGTTYRWRLLAANSAGSSEGQAQTFHTYRSFAAQGGCPNQAFRDGPGATLPDCRAYELVSPLDKNGGDIVAGKSGDGDPGRYTQAAPDGGRVTYTSLAVFADSPVGFQFNQYLSTRGAGGWSTASVHPPANGNSLDPQPGFYRDFIAFTPDLCHGWLVDYQDPPQVAGAPDGYRHLLRRENCAPGAGGLEALTVPESPLPAETGPDYVNSNSVQAVTPDGAHALFRAGTQLTPEAAPCCGRQLYDRFAGKVRLVSVLPNGEAAEPPGEADLEGAAAGSNWSGSLEGALSEDGERAYWSFNGAIYLREHPGQGKVEGECDGEGLNACTRRVSEEGSDFGGAFFWAAAPDGSKALFDQENKLTGKDELRIYDAASDTSQPIAADVRGVAGQGEDLSRVYFVSDEALPGAGANSPWGEEAVAGQPNLYLWEEGEGEGEAEVSFVATLLESDTGKLEPGTDQEAYIIGNPGTYSRGTRASADGSALAFNSRAPLTDFDNTEPASGKPAVEVYRYDAQAGELACVSCNPSGARPRGRELREAYTRPAEDHPTKVIAAAWIRGWEHPLHASRLLSADGERLFFNARDALLPRDTNGADDVYQWEAPGSGSCSTASPSYFPQSGGCLDLISSGKSPTNSEFMEASPDGADVFFTTEAGLLPQDPGSVDLYDARVGGGFPQPVPAPQCAGEACQVAPPPPDDPTPASASFRGPGDPAPVKARGRRCPKGKRAVRRNGSRRCVKPKVRGNKRRANAKGRTGR